jgi:hypothetical protein
MITTALSLRNGASTTNRSTRSRSVADFLVLQLCQLDQHFGGRMLHVEQTQNSCTVICDCHILSITVEKSVKKSAHSNIVDQHFVETNRTQRRLDNVGDGGGGVHCTQFAL